MLINDEVWDLSKVSREDFSSSFFSKAAKSHRRFPGSTSRVSFRADLPPSLPSPLPLLPLQFLESHPGGEDPLLKFAGRDGTPLFNSLHPPGTIEKYIDQGTLDPSAFVGTVDASTVKKRPEPKAEQSSSSGTQAAAPRRKIELGESLRPCLAAAVDERRVADL